MAAFPPAPETTPLILCARWVSSKPTVREAHWKKIKSKGSWNSITTTLRTISKNSPKGEGSRTRFSKRKNSGTSSPAALKRPTYSLSSTSKNLFYLLSLSSWPTIIALKWDSGSLLTTSKTMKTCLSRVICRKREKLCSITPKTQSAVLSPIKSKISIF